MNEVKLLLRDIVRVRIVTRISPISAHITLARGRTRVCLKISTRFDTYLSRSPGLYGFPTTSAEIDFLPAAGQPMFCGYSGSPFDGDRWGKESGLLCDAKCPNIGFDISTRIQQQGLFQEPDHHQINPLYGHMTNKKRLDGRGSRNNSQTIRYRFSQTLYEAKQVEWSREYLSATAKGKAVGLNSSRNTGFMPAHK